MGRSSRFDSFREDRAHLSKSQNFLHQTHPCEITNNIQLFHNSIKHSHSRYKMRKHESMFALAAESATNSPFRMAHGAVLVRSGVVLSTASNHLGGNRLSPSCPSTHAEIATLARFFGGTVKQCFEKPAKALSSLDKQRQSSGFDPPESKSRVSRGSKSRLPRPSRQQRRPGGGSGGGWSVADLFAGSDSRVKCAKRKGKGGKEAGQGVLWY